LRPRYTLEKPVTPQKLVSAISEILGVEIDGSSASAKEDERQKLVQMIGRTDSETLKKIQLLLAK
jgi:hypothetical protein